MKDLHGKKILLFIPNGNGIYGSAVTNELKKRGAEVAVYDERPSQSTSVKVFIRLFKNSFSGFFDKYINEITRKHSKNEFDYVLIIRGEAFTSESVLQLKKAYPQAIFILYLWDSVKNNKTDQIFKYFDKVLSFDKEDVATYPGLIHRPLFFIPEYREVGTALPEDIDILFIGKVHSDRFSFIKGLESFFNSKGLNTFFYFYFPSPLIYIQKKLTDKSFLKSRMSDFQYKMLPASVASNFMRRAKCSLDLQHPLQTGLTMRTIEVLGSKRKLITTNKDIVTYDFYNINNILVVDRAQPAIDIDFINSPYQELEKTVYEKYSLEGWLDDILYRTLQ